MPLPPRPAPDRVASGSEGVDRRTLLRWTGGLIGASTLGVPTGTASAFAQGSDGPVSMAMHIHGSFSEGVASMDAHLHQATRLGVDVIWWTDHDFRAAAFGYRTAVGLDSEHEPEGPWDWSWTPVHTGRLDRASHRFVKAPHSPRETGGALRVNAVAHPASEWAAYQLRAVSDNLLYSTSYCDTTLSLDVRPERIGADAEIVVEVLSSYRPATHGRPAGQYRMQYRIGSPDAGHHLERKGLLGVIRVKARAVGHWQRVRMDLRADHARLWPDTFAGDASLFELRIGVRARKGATARAVVDRLRFARTRRGSGDALAMVREAMHAYRGRYPHVTQYAASEVSLVKHLNAFGGDRVLPAYDMAYAVKDTDDSRQREAIDFLHAHGAVVSLNHPMQDSGGADALARRLVETVGVGADVIEIGTTSDVSTLERVFDIAARNAVFLTANGATDDHDGDDWLARRGRRWLTSVWSPTRRKSDLCHALKAGRAWFHDPLYWRGAFDLLVEGRTAMGGVHFTAKRQVAVRVTATHLPRTANLELVVGRCDRAGATQLFAANVRTTVPSSRVVGGHWSTGVSKRGGVYVRALVRTSGGAVVGFSNPVWVLPEHLVGHVDVPTARR